MEPWILETQTDGVLTLSLNNPSARNAWNAQMEQSLRELLTKADADAAVRAIVLTGHGTSFCPGVDVSAIPTGNHLAALSRQNLQERYGYILRLRKPLIAAINGATAGVGFCLTLFCDLRFMVEDAKLTTAFARRGLVAEHGASWLLPRLIGQMNAADLLLSGRVVTGREAESLGLVRALPREEFLPSVQAYAHDLARNCSPRSMAVIKSQIYAAMQQDFGTAVLMAHDETELAKQSDDFKEGVAHFVERRSAAFPPFVNSHM